MIRFYGSKEQAMKAGMPDPDKDKELRLYEIQFPYFVDNMYKEMDRHYENKGDSYHECTVGYMEELLKKVVDDYFKLDWDHPRKTSQTVDIANICAMLYQRLCGI